MHERILLKYYIATTGISSNIKSNNNLDNWDSPPIALKASKNNLIITNYI